MDRLSTIETLHFTLHDTYLKIFGLYFGEMNRSFFSKLFNLKPKISDSDKALAKEYFQQLEGVSMQLLDEIGRLARRLNAMSAESFEEK